MARFDKRPILELLHGKNYSRPFGAVFEVAMAELVSQLNPSPVSKSRLNLNGFEGVYLAMRPIYDLIGEQLRLNESKLPRTPDYNRALIEAKQEQLELLERIYGLGVSFECEHLIIALNEKMKGELERFQHMDSGSTIYENELLKRLKTAWAKLVPDKGWSFYRDDANSEFGISGRSYDFVQLIVSHIPKEIRPVPRSLAG